MLFWRAFFYPVRISIWVLSYGILLPVSLPFRFIYSDRFWNLVITWLMRSIYKANLSSWKSILDMFRSLEDAFKILTSSSFTLVSPIQVIRLSFHMKRKPRRMRQDQGIELKLYLFLKFLNNFNRYHEDLCLGFRLYYILHILHSSPFLDIKWLREIKSRSLIKYVFRFVKHGICVKG